MRLTASRWLFAIAFSAVLCFAVPGLAAAADSAVADPVAATEPGAPAGEVTPTTPATEPTEPTAPAGDTGTVVTEPTTPTDGGAAEAPAPPPADAPTVSTPVPGTEATPTPAPSPVSETPVASQPLPVSPDAPVTTTTLIQVPAPPAPPSERIAASTPSIPTVSPPTAPDSPGALVANADTATEAPVLKTHAAAPITDFGRTLNQVPSTPVLSSPAAITSDPVAPDVTVFPEGPTVDLNGPTIVAPAGAAPAGSSLLAVLAGYVLPGSSGPPASTLVMLIVIGLILGVGYAARPGLTEAVASATLLGASSGHGMAVRRPG